MAIFFKISSFMFSLVLFDTMSDSWLGSIWSLLEVGIWISCWGFSWFGSMLVWLELCLLIGN